jgi:hypothetical protein
MVSPRKFTVAAWEPAERVPSKSKVKYLRQLRLSDGGLDFHRIAKSKTCDLHANAKFKAIFS